METTMTVSSGVLDVHDVGIAGWGRMGSWMGHYLVKGGWPVKAFDPSPDAQENIREFGAAPVADLASLAAGCELVLVVVVDDEQVRSVIRASLPSARPGTVFAVCASVRPDTCAEMAEEARAVGCHVIDVALVGGERGAEAGALKLMCGGEKAPIDACSAAFASFAIDVCHIGDIGAGQIAKTVNNILLWACIRADVEALRLAKSLGISPGRLRSFVNIGSGANAPLREWGQHRLRWPKKDLEVALALAAEAGVAMPFVEALAPLMDELTVSDLHELR
jgi:3-hydroxyisobutyrate dehydrogenase-like beta-hydroxyacid dehydrogenase